MRSLLFGATFLFAVARVASAQSSGEPNLAEIARQAEAAKATIPKAKKSYTNADLNNGGLPPAPAAPATGFMSASLGKPVSAEEMLKLSAAKDAAAQAQKRPESFWVGQADRAIEGPAEEPERGSAETDRSGDGDASGAVREGQEAMDGARRRGARRQDQHGLALATTEVSGIARSGTRAERVHKSFSKERRHAAGVQEHDRLISSDITAAHMRDQRRHRL
jgi:hypothetical protein